MTTIVLWVANLEKSANFYKALFEDNAPYISETFASVSNNDNEVLLHLLPEEYRGEPSIGEDNPIKPVFNVKSIELAKLAAGRTGGSFQGQAFEHEPWRYLDGKDPDGHVIQIRERI